MKIKRCLSILIVVSALLALALPQSAWSQFTYTTNNDTITITGYTGPGGAVTIPDTINGLPVTTIGDGVDSIFTNTGVTSVILGTSVTSIEAASFSGCSSLTNVIIPDSVIYIGPGVDLFDDNTPGAFEGCISLTGIIIPNSLHQIPNVTFSGCTKLTSVIIGTNVTSIGYEAFYNCGLTNLVIPNSVTSIGGGWPFPGAFEYCTQLSSVTLPDRLSRIDELEFLGCGLTSVNIPSSVTSIGDGAFASCVSLTNVTIPASVTTIGDGSLYEGAFESCSSLNSIRIPASVSYIATMAFAECTALTGVFFFGNAPGSIGDNYSEFDGDYAAVAYYLPGTSGWGSTYDDIPARLWNPQAQTSGANFGVVSNRFGFTINGAANIPLVIEAATNLDHPSWVTLFDGTLTNGSIYFSDPAWTNYPSRFYRVRSP